MSLRRPPSVRSPHAGQRGLPLLPLVARALFFGWATTAAVSGCAEDYAQDRGAAGATPVSNCTTDDDCGEGQVCEQGLCTVEAAPSTTLSLHVVPPPSSGALPQQWLDVRVGPQRLVPDLRLRPTVTLSGTVHSDNLLAASIPARIVATAHDTIPGTSLKQSATAANGGGYTLTLLEGVAYDLTVYPDSDQLPPLTDHAVCIHAEDATRDQAVHNIRLPAASEYASLSGRVVFAQGDAQGVDGVRVQAFGDDPSLLSTVAVSAGGGSFRLTLPPGKASYTLRLSPTPDNKYLPTVDQGNLVVDGALELGDVPLGGGAVPPVTVAGKLVDAQGQAVTSGADIEFRAHSGRGTYVSRNWVDLTGEFRGVELLPEVYSLRVVPAPDSDYAITLLSRSVLSDSTLEPIMVGGKAAFDGKVIDPHGALPVPGVQVEALLVGTDGMSGLYRVERQVTDLQGAFHLQLDRGVFDITLVPPAASGMPRWVERGVELDAAPVHEFQLRQPRVVHGAVLEPGGDPAQDVQVSVYGPDADGTGATLLGSGPTDASGRYVIVLPLEP